MTVKNFGEVLRDITTGKALAFDNGEERKVKSYIVDALLNPFRNEDATGEQKAKQFALALKLQQGGDEVDLSTDELALIKKRVGETGTAAVVGPIFNILDGK